MIYTPEKDKTTGVDVGQTKLFEKENGLIRVRNFIFVPHATSFSSTLDNQNQHTTLHNAPFCTMFFFSDITLDPLLTYMARYKHEAG